MNPDVSEVLPYLGKLKPHGKEYNVEVCPFCKGGDHHDKNKFYVNKETGLYTCHRGSCGEKGNLFQLKQKLGLSNTYVKPKIITSPISTIESYWKSRQISLKTLSQMKVEEFDGATSFPYFFNGEIVLMKYRKQTDEGKQCWQETGGMPVLWNMDFIDTKKPVIITEGEPDALSVYQAGFPNVVSVPFGAKNLVFFDTCRDFLAKCNQFILYLDNDPAGVELQQKLIEKLGKYRCKIVYHELKDANEELMKYGIDYLASVINNSSYPDSYEIEYFKDVIEDDERSRISSGFTMLDDAIGQFSIGQVTIWTGKPSSGKSTVINQCLLKAIEQGYKCFVYSGELSNQKIKHWILRTAAGSNNVIVSGYNYRIIPEYESKISEWIGNNILFFNRKISDDISSDSEADKILSVMEFVRHRDNCQVFLIDNLMTATIGSLTSNDFYQQQVVFMKKLITFAEKNDCHIHVVIHQGKGKESGNDNVSGMAQLTQLTQNSIMIVRPDKDNIDKQGRYVDCSMFPDGTPEDARIEVLKCRDTGSRKKILLKFEPKSKRFYGLMEDPNYQYPWKELEVSADIKQKQSNDMPDWAKE